MSTYRLSPGDVSTLNEAADLTVAQAKAALRECKKCHLDDAVRLAERLEACAEESKTFLANLERGAVDLSGGHVEALAAGLRILYGEVKKERTKALGFFVNSEGFDVRLQEIRDTT